MTILEMIAEWRKGCGNTVTDDDGNVVNMRLHPEKCPECTLALIVAIERACEQTPSEITLYGCATQAQAERSVAWLDAHNEWVKQTTK